MGNLSVTKKSTRTSSDVGRHKFSELHEFNFQLCLFRCKTIKPVKVRSESEYMLMRIKGNMGTKNTEY